MAVQSGLRKGLETTWGDTGLFARAAIYDITSGVPALVTNVIMGEVVPGQYIASFVPVEGVSYYVSKRVFTDGTYTVLDDGFPGSSEEFQCVDFYSAASSSGDSVIAGEIVGIVEDENEVIGVLSAA